MPFSRSSPFPALQVPDREADLLVLLGARDSASEERLRSKAEATLARRRGVLTIRRAPEVTKEDLAGRAVALVGTFHSNPGSGRSPRTSPFR